MTFILTLKSLQRRQKWPLKLIETNFSGEIEIWNSHFLYSLLFFWENDLLTRIELILELLFIIVLHLDLDSRSMYDGPIAVPFIPTKSFYFRTVYIQNTKATGHCWKLQTKKPFIITYKYSYYFSFPLAQ